MGRASKYETCVQPFLLEIPKWYKEQTEGQIAKRLGVSRGAFEKYKRENEELRDALAKGKTYLADDLKDALRKKALGFEYTETKTVTKGDAVEITETKRYSPPDVGAIHLLLKNIDNEWRNDDAPTMALKEKALTMREKKIENEEW